MRAAVQHGESQAVVTDRSAVSYADLADRAARLGAGLKELGLEPGERVALLQPNGMELFVSIFGAWMAGVTVVPINSRAHPREAAFIVRNSESKAVIYGAEYEAELVAALGDEGEMPLLVSTGDRSSAVVLAELIATAEPLPQPVERRHEDTAWLFYTSGTTGRPKGAILSHRNLRQMILSHLADVRSFEPGETVLHAAPLTHGSGLVMLACVARGARNLLYCGRSFDGAEVLDLVAREGVRSVAFLAPTQIVALNRAAAQDGSTALPLESICYGGAPMFIEDLRAAMDIFGPVFVQIYGQGEAPMTITVLAASDHERFQADGDSRIGSAGIPRTDVEIRVVDEDGSPCPPGRRGEVIVRGDVVMTGYWDNPDATAAALHDGWLRTGDIGLIDELGYLHLLDRSKDMIISGGNNIYPREIEEAILELPDVEAVAVIGVPDPYWGENVHAMVVSREGAELTEELVVEHCRGMLSSYKKPKTVEFVSELPTNAYGKVLKRDLREARQGLADAGKTIAPQ
ncbi:MAG: AMP-binding protein [Solirubrobacterales bacterium]